MPRCAEPSCGRWRPTVGFAGGRLASIRFNGRWYCSRGCVESAAREGLDVPAALAGSAAALPPPRIGVLLRYQGLISDAQLGESLDAQRRTGLKLGAQMCDLGFVDRDVVLRALAEQAGVSYLTSFDLRRVKGIGTLPVPTVRALGVVPFEIDEVGRRVNVICAAPMPRTALRALAKLTDWTPEPFLVRDDVLAAALEAYRPADAEGRHDVQTVPDLTAAAARVAEAAARGREVTMRHATCDDHVWVRVEGKDRVSDVIVTGAAA
jgi:hypothetical protein